jgi:hypothetical protein
MCSGDPSGTTDGPAQVLGWRDYHQPESHATTKRSNGLRNRQEFQRSQLTELASTDFESWESKRRQEGFNLRLRSFDPGGADRRGVAR